MPNVSRDVLLDGLLDYATALPGNKKHPLEVLVLRAHLLIEREVRELVLAKCKRVGAVDARKIQGAFGISLAEALYGDAVRAEIWASLKDLNELRNKVAHQLESEAVESVMASFVSRFEKREPRADFVKRGVMEQLAYCLADLHSELLKVRDSSAGAV